jgi:hypothetical protein
MPFRDVNFTINTRGRFTWSSDRYPLQAPVVVTPTLPQNEQEDSAPSDQISLKDITDELRAVANQLAQVSLAQATLSASNLKPILQQTNCTMDIGNAYFVQSLTMCMLTLPELPQQGGLGAEIAIYNVGPSVFRIIQNPGNVIQLGDVTTTYGAVGRIDAYAVGDAIMLSYLGESKWFANILSGNFAFA